MLFCRNQLLWLLRNEHRHCHPENVAPKTCKEWQDMGSELSLCSGRCSEKWHSTPPAPLVSFYDVFTTPSQTIVLPSALQIPYRLLSEEMIFFYSLWPRFWRCIVFCRHSWRWRIVRMGLQVGWRHLLLLAINARRTVSSLIDLLWMAIVCRVVCVYLLSRGVAFPTPSRPIFWPRYITKSDS